MQFNITRKISPKLACTFSQVISNPSLKFVQTNASSFRNMVNTISVTSKLSVLHLGSSTILYDEHRKICAMIRAPYLNAYGKIQPLQYHFLADRQSLSAPLVPLTYFFLSKLTNVLYAFSRTTGRISTDTYKLLFSFFSSLGSIKRLDSSLFSRQSKSIQKTHPVWTTIRLTA